MTRTTDAAQSSPRSVVNSASRAVASHPTPHMLRPWGAAGALSVHFPVDVRMKDVQPGEEDKMKQIMRTAKVRRNGGQREARDEAGDTGNPLLTVLALAEKGHVDADGEEQEKINEGNPSSTAATGRRGTAKSVPSASLGTYSHRRSHRVAQPPPPPAAILPYLYSPPLQQAKKKKKNLANKSSSSFSLSSAGANAGSFAATSLVDGGAAVEAADATNEKINGRDHPSAREIVNNDDGGYVLDIYNDSEDTASASLFFQTQEDPHMHMQQQGVPLVQARSTGQVMPLQRIRLHGHAPTSFSSSSSTFTFHIPAIATSPVVIKASLLPIQEGSELQVSPTYLSLKDPGRSSTGRGSSPGLKVTLQATGLREYRSVLLLQYRGTQVKIPLMGLISSTLHSDKDEDEGERPYRPSSLAPSTTLSSCATVAAESAVVLKTSSSTTTSIPVTWRKLMVGCSSSRDLQIRNCSNGSNSADCSGMTTSIGKTARPCTVKTCIDAGSSESFEVSGGLPGGGKVEVGPEDLLSLRITFRPLTPGMHKGTLSIIVACDDGTCSSSLCESMYQKSLVCSCTHQSRFIISNDTHINRSSRSSRTASAGVSNPSIGYGGGRQKETTSDN